MFYVALLLILLVAGSLVYCLLVIVGAQKFLREQTKTRTGSNPPVSLLKPLAGADEGLSENLRSFFDQRYDSYEILFAVRFDGDPAVPIVRKLQAEYPGTATRLLITGEPPYANAKVWALECMSIAAAHPLWVMSDSDVRVTPEMLATVASEFADADVGVTTCLYRAVPGKSLWSLLEAIGMNTEFASGILVARMLEGMRFALGPTISARKQVIEQIGGWKHLSEYLAEDFVIGNKAAELGWKVLLSSYVIEHRIGSQEFLSNCRHRLRWYRSTRRSRPAGYVGQLFTNPLPLALMAAMFWWPILPIAVLVRAGAAYAVAGITLKDPLTRSHWYLVPLQDILSFIFWIAGFFGSTILWRGRRYKLLRDGRFELCGEG